MRQQTLRAAPRFGTARKQTAVRRIHCGCLTHRMKIHQPRIAVKNFDDDENSPAIYGWVKCPMKFLVPRGTAENFFRPFGTQIIGAPQTQS
jgi:hypothetical protein